MSKIIHKKSSIPGRIPQPGDLDFGELAINYADGVLYYKNSNNAVSAIAAGSGSGSSAAWVVKTANYTAQPGENILANTSGGSFTITLPAAPTAGAAVTIADGGNWETNSLTVARNNRTIESLNEDFVLDISGITVTFVYSGNTWQLFTTAGLREVPILAGNAGKYLTTDGTSLTWTDLNSIATRQTYTATADQTTFSINYTANNIDVYLNGVKLINGVDFTATNGTTIVLSTAADAGDVVDIVAALFTSTGTGSADLDAIANLTGTSGYLKKTAANTWSLIPGITQLISPNGSSVVYADDATAMPNEGHSFIHTVGRGPLNNDGHILGMTWANTTSAYGAQIWLDTDPTGQMAFRQRDGSGVWTSWNNILHSNNIGDYALSLNGGTIEGPVEISTSSTNGNYNEGLRITAANNGKASITFGSVGLSGAPTNGWFIGRLSSNFFVIAPGSDNGENGLALNPTVGGNALWKNNVLLHAGNYNSYALPLSGGTLTGDLILSAANVSIGGTAQRTTTIGTNAIQLFNGTAPVGTLTNGVSLYASSGDLFFMDAAGTASRIGFRGIPQSGSAKTSSYTLTTSDVGDYIQVSSGGSIVIPDSTFATGDVVSIFNNTSGTINITCSITTAYIAGTDSDKATMTLASRGVATILFISGTICVVSGNVT